MLPFLMATDSLVSGKWRAPLASVRYTSVVASKGNPSGGASTCGFLVLPVSILAGTVQTPNSDSAANRSAAFVPRMPKSMSSSTASFSSCKVVEADPPIDLLRVASVTCAANLSHMFAERASGALITDEIDSGIRFRRRAHLRCLPLSVYSAEMTATCRVNAKAMKVRILVVRLYANKRPVSKKKKKGGEKKKHFRSSIKQLISTLAHGYVATAASLEDFVRAVLSLRP